MKCFDLAIVVFLGQYLLPQLLCYKPLYLFVRVYVCGTASAALKHRFFSGGTCETVYKYDIGALGTAMAPIKLPSSPESIYKDQKVNLFANENIR